jgi:hypothetical protein
MQIDVRGLKDVQKAIRQYQQPILGRKLRRSLMAGGRILQKEMRALAPKDSGKLRRSIYARRARDRESVVVGPKVPYAHIVVRGAAPHAIPPRDRGSLTFGGRHVEEVWHPGVQGNPFPERAAQRSSKRILDTVFNELVRR